MDTDPKCNSNPPIVKGLALEASQANRIDQFLVGQDTARNHAPRKLDASIGVYCMNIVTVELRRFYTQGNVGAWLVRDDPKLLDDGGEIPKSQGRGWRFDSQL